MKEDFSGGFERLPEKCYTWEIFEVSELIKKTKSVQRTWKLNTYDGSDVEQVWVYMRPFEYKPILEAIGYKAAEDGSIDWEPSDIKGKKFQAVLTWREFQKKYYAQLSMIQPAISADDIQFGD